MIKLMMDIDDVYNHDLDYDDEYNYDDLKNYLLQWHTCVLCLFKPGFHIIVRIVPIAPIVSDYRNHHMEMLQKN